MNQTPSIISPIHGPAKKLSAQFVEIAGWQVPQVYLSVEKEVAAARNGVALADATSTGKLQIEGQSSETVIQTTRASSPAIIGQGVISDFGHIYRLRNDQFFIHSPPGTVGSAIQRLIEVTRERSETVTVTDISHGRADLLLVGPDSPNLMSRLCGLDFHSDRFPDLSAKHSSVAKSRQLTLRHDMGEIPAYSLIGARSLGAYIWETILEAGHDLGIIPIGQSALEKLQQENRSGV